MGLSGVVTGAVGAVSTASLLAFVSWVFPSARWTRRLKRDMEILAGLPEGPEKEQWGASVVALARRLRAYEKFVPLWHRVLPFAMAVVWGILITIFIVDPQVRTATLGEQPAIALGIAGLVGTIGYLWVAMAGGDLHGRDPDVLLAEEEAPPETEPDR
jgi:hypothetical protein